MRFGEAVSDLLSRSYGVEVVFGIPGVHTVELFRGLGAQGVRAVVPRHEQGAGFMADAYARTSGEPGVCFLITGPGLLNALTPMAQAWHDSVPMLVVAATTATTELRRGRGPLHDVGDQAAIAAQVTSISETVTDPDRFAELVSSAWGSWATGRPRPVHLSIPVDVLEREVGAITAVPHATSPRAPDEALVREAAALLGGAARPVVLAGGGALRAAGELTRLAERLDAPVVTTGNGKGLLPPDHPLHVGALLPFAPVLALLADADVVLVVGSELSDVDRQATGAPLELPGALVRLDVDEGQFAVPLRQPGQRRVDLAADASTGLDAIVRALTVDAPSRRGQRADLRASWGADRAARARDAVDLGDQARAHSPWLDALAGVVTEDVTVVLDSTQLAYTALHALPASRPGQVLAPYGLGTLGPALPMAIGARLGRQRAGHPSAPALAVAGDGGALFTLPELATAMDVGGPLVLLVWDNAGYAEIRDSFDRVGAPRTGTETTAHDLVAIAQGFGARARRVADPAAMAGAVAAGLAGDRPSVVVVTEPGSPADPRRS